MFKRLFTWKGRISRREFIITFILGILLIHVFPYIASYILSQHYSFGNSKFNIAMGLSYTAAILGIIWGLLPLLIFNLYSINEMVIRWNGVYGIDFLPLLILIDILFVLYLFQCFKRCHDLGDSGLYSLIPIWNPLALLFLRGDEGENDYGLEEEPDDEKNENERLFPDD